MRIPSEPALCREYHIARSTLRRALKALEADKVIRREKGRGTFVSSAPLVVQLKKLTGSIDDFITHGIATYAKVYAKKPILAPQRVAQVLRVQDGDVVAHIARVRYVEDRPLAYISGYLPWDVGSRVLEEELEHLSILHILTRKYRIPVPKAEQTVEATVADLEISRYLDAPVGSPVLKIERVFFSRKRRPVFYADSYYRADRYKFGVILNGRKITHTSLSVLMQTPGER